MRNCITLLIFGLSCPLFSTTTLAGQAVFVDLGKHLFAEEARRGLPWGAEIQVSSVAGNGSVVGGSIIWPTFDLDCANLACEQSAFAWSVDSAQPLMIPSQESVDSRPWRRAPLAVSAFSANGEVATVAFDQRDGWYQAESSLVQGMSISELDPQGTENGWFYANAMSEDASVVVGQQLGRDNDGRPSRYHALRWSEEAGFEEIPVETPWSTLQPVAVSGDGNVVVLSDVGASLGYRVDAVNAVTWTEGGFSDLPPTGGTSHSTASAASYDGSVIVGTSHGSGEHDSVATEWVSGIPFALTTPSDFTSSATDITVGGAVVVGEWRPTDSGLEEVPWNAWEQRIEMMRRSEAVIWAEGEPTIVERLLAESYGLDDALAGWSLTSAEVVSDDGRVIAGHGIDPRGVTTAWVAVLPVPEPSPIALLVIGVLPVVHRARF